MNKWYNEAVFYHIYPLGLTGAPKENTQSEVTGHFDELCNWIAHIKELGCTAIYIGPLFDSSTHGYDTRDYKLVDKRLGTNEDFKEFVELAHGSGIKVVVDGVFNHTGREFFAFKDIQEKREQSPYCKWYKGVHFGGDNPYHDGFGYEAWRNCYELANLNLWEREVRDYLLDVIRYWIDVFDIDGIRLDCADCLDFDFLKEMRMVTDAAKEGFWLMGEVIHGDYARWVNDRMLHSTTNYELHKGLYSGHNDHNYFEIAHTVKREFDENGGIYRGKRLYSFVDNHDVDRIMSKLSNKEHVMLVYTLMYTLPGIPSVYYGSEWGITGEKVGASDDGMRPELSLPEMIEGNLHPELTEHIKVLGELKKKLPELSEGIYRELVLTNRQYAFARMMADRAVIVAVNNDEAAAEMQIPLPVAASKCSDVLTGEEIKFEGGRVSVNLKACSSAIIKID